MPPFVTSAHLRFRDGDLYGHVNNAVHLSLFETARIEFYQLQGPGGTSFDQLVGSMNFALIKSQRIDYFAPLLVRLKPISIELWVTRIGSTSFDLNYRLTDEDGGVVYAGASSVLVQASRSTGRPVALSRDQREHLEHYLSDARALTP